MTKKIIVLTPHPDDETLGCGGTLLKYLNNGDQIYWLIVTGMNRQYAEERRTIRQKEIQRVAAAYQFTKVFQMDYPAAELDQVSTGDLINSISEVFKEIEPNVVYVPYPGDIHSDHKIVFDTTMACTKWFRYPSVKRVLVYETLSETDFAIDPDIRKFNPNVFVNIENFLDKKIDIMNIYASEISEFPFPRSEKAIRSLAYIRGAASGYEAAESFMLLKEREN